MNADYAIWADSLTKHYRSGGADITVFDDLNLRVHKGERIAVIGQSGAGKSTLLHLLGGLDMPDTGRIIFAGADITQLTADGRARFRNRQLGFVWQSPSLLPEFTALENVAMPLSIRGVPQEAALKTGSELLDEVGLGNRLKHRAGELSGGEQQRVAIARALAGTPSFLLADEPTGSLDFRTGAALIGLLNEVHARHSLTSIFVTHNLSFAKQCDRVLELKKGKLQIPADEELWELQGAGVVQGATRLDGGTYV